MDTYEQKYKSALERVNKMVSDGHLFAETAEEYFPELKESEDERIRNLLIEFFNNATRNKYNMGIGVSNERILAWLEKQGEQKPADELEAKGYQWSGKSVVKTQPEKFDITTLKPFDEVLIRELSTTKWGVGLYAYYEEGTDHPFRCMYSTWRQCVPYNDETKHLLGTTADATDFYKTWR